MNHIQENNKAESSLDKKLKHARNKNMLKPGQKNGSAKLALVTEVQSTDYNGSVKTALVTAGNTRAKLVSIGDISTQKTTHNKDQYIFIFCTYFMILWHRI